MTPINKNIKQVGKNKNIDWDNQPLGKIPDSGLANILDVSTSTVYAQRRARGIPPSQPRKPYVKSYSIDWDAQPLGKIADSKIANELNISVAAVRMQRAIRGIEPFRKHGTPRKSKYSHIDWDKEPLGKVTDGEIAEKYDIPRSAVVRERIKRGISGFEFVRRDWDSQPLGEVADTKIAAKLGVSRERVRQIREKKGIPSWQGQNLKKIHEELENLGLAGSMSDNQIAKFSGISISRVNRFRRFHGIEPAEKGYKIDWDTIDFEGKTDGELSKELNIPQDVIGRKRRARGIPAQVKSEKGVCLRKGINWDEQPLGKMSDGELAKRTGVSRHTVYKARTHRGIPSFKRPKKDS